MSTFSKRSTLLFFCIISVAVSFGAHMLGGVITYKPIQGKKYEVYIKVWRDCSQIAANAENLRITDASGNLLRTVYTSSQTKVYAKDVSLIDSLGSCAALSRCQSSASGLFSIEEAMWKMEVDFATLSSSCEYYLSWNQYNRSASITTGSAGQDIFLDAYLNLCFDTAERSLLQDNFPDFTIIYNQDYNFSPAFFSEENFYDSISYELAPALYAANQSVLYAGVLNADRPFNFLGFPNQNLVWPGGFRVEPQTGNLQFRPTQANQMGPIDILYKTWKEVNDTMRLVGYSRFDYTPKIISAQNSSVLSFVSGADRLHQVCVGTTFCKEYRLTAGGDSVFLNILPNHSNIQIDTLSWQPDTVHIRVCFTPDTNDLGNQNIGVLFSYYRSVCPLYRRNSEFHCFRVVPAPDSSIIPAWRVERDCNTLKILVEDTAQAGLPLYVKARMQNQYKRDSSIYQLTSSDTGWVSYQIRQEWGGCDLLFEDSVYIDSLFTFQTHLQSPDYPCLNADFTVYNQVSGGKGILFSQWSNLTSGTDSVSFRLLGDTAFWIYLEDSSGCIARDTLQINAANLPGLELPEDTAQCKGNSISLRPNYSNSDSLQFFWNNAISPGVDSLTIQVDFDTLIILRVLDRHACVNEDSTFLRALEYPRAHLISPVADSACEKALVWIEVDTLGLGANGLVQTIPTGLHRSNLRIEKDTSIRVITTNSEGCTSDSVWNLRSIALPQINIADTQFLCWNAAPVNLTPWASPVAGVWYSQSVMIQSGIFYPAGGDTGFHQLFYAYTFNGCTSVDSMLVYVEEVPQVSFVADSITGKAPLNVQFSNQTSGAGPLHFTWYFGDGDSSDLKNPSHQYTVPGIYTVSLEVAGKDCRNSYTRINYIQVAPSSGVGMDLPNGKNVRVYPNPGNGVFQIEGVSDKAVVKVLDATGREVRFNQGIMGEGIQVELIDCPSGVYMLQIDEHGDRYSIRLIKSSDN